MKICRAEALPYSVEEVRGAVLENIPKLEWVKKRDGRIVPFQKEKIAQAIYKALKTTGQDDLLFAQEMAEAVTHYLGKNGREQIPDIETIQDTVERILVEMKLFETAKAYILYRDKRARIREAMEQVTALKESGLKEFRLDRGRIVRALVQEIQIPWRLAERITDIVEANCTPSPQGDIPPNQLDLSIN